MDAAAEVTTCTTWSKSSIKKVPEKENNDTSVHVRCHDEQHQYENCSRNSSLALHQCSREEIFFPGLFFFGQKSSFRKSEGLFANVHRWLLKISKLFVHVFLTAFFFCILPYHAVRVRSNCRQWLLCVVSYKQFQDVDVDVDDVDDDDHFRPFMAGTKR